MTRRNSKNIIMQCSNYYWFFLLLGAFCVHFHSLEIFSRPLIDHDDTIFIKPMLDLVSNHGWKQYFSNWLVDRSHYGFPLRDLTFFIDYCVSNALGIQTYWLTNFIFFALSAWFSHKIFKLFFSKQKLLPMLLDGILLFHPITVEMIQWASMRKHLMAAFFIQYGSFYLLKLYLNEESKVTKKDFARFAGVTFFSLMCWPTAILWPLASIFLLRKKLIKQKAPILALCIGSFAFWAIAFKVISSDNTDYSRNQATLFSSVGFEQALNWGWRSLGRATFNLLLPIRQSAYYNVDSVLNQIGFVIFCAAVIALIVASLRSQLKKQIDILVYALFFFAPQFFVVLVNSGLVWADHYLYSVFPFLILSLALTLHHFFKNTFLQVQRSSQITAIATLIAIYVVLSLQQIPDWKSAIDLLQSCWLKEEAPLCVILTIEKKYDRAGCSEAFDGISQAKEIYVVRKSRNSLKLDSPFELELPMMESLCIATASNIDLKTKMSLIREQKSFYNKPTSFLFSEVLSFLNEKDLPSAWKLATSTYLDPNFIIKQPNEKILTLLGGQAEALCSLSQKLAPQNNALCQSLLRQYRQRTSSFIYDGAGKAGIQTQWAKNISSKNFYEAL